MTWVDLYTWVSPLLKPIAVYGLKKRAARGKEDSLRLSERMGHPSLKRPSGPLIWVHAVSVGESVSILPVIERLVEQGHHVLITTGTVTSAHMMAERLPKGAVHQYIPFDIPAWVNRFLDHWHPDAAVLVESELWPNLILRTHQRQIPLILLGGRMSAPSYQSWSRRSKSAKKLLSCFAYIGAQSDLDADRFAGLLGDAQVVKCMNLKLAAPPLPCDQEAFDQTFSSIGDRPVWVAASTHPGEEAILLAAHEKIQESFPGCLLILVPRHPERGQGLTTQVQQFGMTVALRSLGDSVTEKVQVYIADTIGELGVWYRITDVVFVGGSLVQHGGQNPLEAARLSCVVLTGPHMENFPWLDAVLPLPEARRVVWDDTSLAAEVMGILQDTSVRQKTIESAAARLPNADQMIHDTVQTITGLMRGKT